MQAVEAPSPRGKPVSLFGCITAFSHRAAPMLVATLESAGTNAMHAELGALAVQVGLGDLKSRAVGDALREGRGPR